MRNLTRREFLKVNKEIDFDDLEVGMELTVDDTDEPGWYEVVSIRNWRSMSEDFVVLALIDLNDEDDHQEEELNDLLVEVMLDVMDEKENIDLRIDKDLMKNILKIDKRTDTSYFLYINPTRNDKEFILELTFCYPNNNYNKSLPNLWFKNGFTDKVLNNYIHINTYQTDSKGHCWGTYNPQNNKGKINFNHMNEISTHNLNNLIKKTIECYYKGDK